MSKLSMRHKLGIYFNTHNTTTQLSELGRDILASHLYLSLVSLLGMPVCIPVSHLPTPYACLQTLPHHQSSPSRQQGRVSAQL